MNFNEYYKQQLRLQKLFKEICPGSEASHSGNNQIDEARFKDHILLLIKEVTEILDEINFKPHVQDKKEINKTKIAEELVDTFKFLLNLMIIMNIKPQEFEKKYAEKHKIVEKRIKNERKNDLV